MGEEGDAVGEEGGKIMLGGRWQKLPGANNHVVFLKLKRKYLGAAKRDLTCLTAWQGTDATLSDGKGSWRRAPRKQSVGKKAWSSQPETSNPPWPSRGWQKSWPRPARWLSMHPSELGNYNMPLHTQKRQCYPSEMLTVTLLNIYYVPGSHLGGQHEAVKTAEVLDPSGICAHIWVEPDTLLKWLSCFSCFWGL